jgi:anti-sigma regulatory factor (Ser/Thr protein kinase)
MTDSPLLNFSILALSLFNTILLVWLGLTILLNAERRAWGVWLIGGGILAGAFFFVSHTAIFGIGRNPFTLTSIDFWWRAGWPALVLNPLAWYIAVLWYAGFWDDQHAALHRRQRPWFALTGSLAAVLLLALLFSPFLPSFEQLAELNLSSPLSLGGIPLIFLAYIFFILLCTGLSVDALARPGPSLRVLGQQARARARPWLIAASITLVLVVLLVSGVMIWVVGNAQGRLLDPQIPFTVAFADLLISGLLAFAILVIGQSFVAYEIFTGAALPRRGLARGWRRVIVLAAGYSVLVGGAFALNLHPIYSLLLTALLMTAFFALLNWRAFAERERQMRLLRPFVSPEGLYDQLVTGTSAETMPAFDELIENVLYARQGYLIPVGARAALVEAYACPRGDLPPVADLTARVTPETLFVPVEPARGGAVWAIPLWVGQNLGGLLLLGEKRDGSLYAQEEIELAQAAGERLLDTQASAELARRLAALQRRELAETQIADRRTRRTLHDDVLPQIHAALLTLPSDHPAVPELTAVHRQISALLREMPPATTPEFARKGVFDALRQVGEGELAGSFDEVVWDVPEEVADRARALPPLEAEVLFYAAREVLRNSAKHGRGAGRLGIKISASWEGRLEVVVEDFGEGGEGRRGEKEKRGTGEESAGGAGSGLALHGTMLAVVGGELVVEEGGRRVIVSVRGERLQGR